jgi:hypothetical protein
MNKQEIKDRQQERYNRGARAEEEFLQSFQCKYPNEDVKKSTKQQDMFDHIDCFAGSNSYDIKSLKKKSAKDDSVDSNIIWIEFKNVRGNLGWLYGKATRIAFELEDKFICVERESLRKRAESLTIKKYTNYPTAYHLYGRRFSPEQERDRGYRCSDVMTFIYLSDIKDIIVEEIPKCQGG